MAAGSIIVDLLMRTGAFETDTDRAAKALQRLKKQAETAGTVIGTSLVAGAALATVAFQKLVSAAGDFKDLEEQTGAAAEDLASLAVSASVAGISVEEVATQANRLTKSLTGVDDESKAAGAALSALGIPIEQFKQLDPVGQIDALSKAFAGFSDKGTSGAQKVAVAMALFGKNGAQMLSLFKELEASGGRQKILTQDQIELADEYGDKQKRLAATLTAYAQAAATDLLPALTAVTGVAVDVVRELAGIDDQGRKLAGTSYVKDFAESSAIVLAKFADSIGETGAEITRFVAQTQKEFASLKFGAQALANFGSIGQAIVEGKGPVADALRERNQTIAEANATLLATTERDGKKYEKLVRETFAKVGVQDPNQSSAESARLARKPSLQFSGAEKSTGSKDRQSEADRYLETLQKQAEKTLDLSSYEQALLDIQQKRIKGLTPDLERQILAQAQFNDLNKQAIDLRTAEVEALSKRSRAQLDELGSLAKSNVELQKEIDLLGLTKDELNEYELQQVRIARALKERELAQQSANLTDEGQTDVLEAQIAALRQREELLQQKGDKQTEVETQKGLKDDVRDSVADGFAEGLLEGGRRGLSLSEIFLRELKAQFAKQVLSPIIKPVLDVQNDTIAQILKLFGVNTSGLSIDTSGYSYQGATLPDSIRGGADTGTNYVERDMVTLLHKGEAVVPKAYNPAAGGGAAGGVNVNVHNYGNDTVQASQGQDGGVELVIGAAHARVVRDFATGTGPAATAARQRQGTGPGALARRG